MKTTLPGGKIVNFPDSMSSDERNQVITRMLGEGQESEEQPTPQTLPRRSTVKPSWWQNPMPGDEEPGAMGVQTPAIPKEAFPSTDAGPLPEGMAMQATPKQTKEWGGIIEDTYVDPITVAAGVGGIVGNLAVKAGVPLIQAATRALAASAASVPFEYLWGGLTEEAIPEPYRLPFNLAGSLLTGGIENKLADIAASNSVLAAKWFGKKISNVPKLGPLAGRKKVDMKTGSQIVKEVTGEETPYVQKLNKDEEEYVPKTSKEIFGDDDIPDFAIERAELAEKAPEVERKLFGQIDPERSVPPMAGPLGDNREKLAIKPVGARGLLAGRYGAMRLENGEWRLFEKAGEQVEWAGGKLPNRKAAGEALGKIVELDELGQPVNVMSIAKQYSKASKSDKVVALKQKQQEKERVKALGKLTKEFKLGKDTYSVDMIETSEPLLKGRFGDAKEVTGEQVRSIVRRTWEEFSLVTDGVADVTPEKLRILNRVDGMMDIVHANPKSKGNIEALNKEITRAENAGEIGPTQATMMRELNNAARYPLNFGLDISERSEDLARASYNSKLRLISLDPARSGPYVYAHEFSHWGWWEVLSSAERMTAAKEIAGLVETGAIKSMLPLSEAAPGLLKSEMEIFAEMSGEYMLHNIMPKYVTKGILGAIARVAEATKRVARRMLTKRAMSPELEAMFKKIADVPKPIRQPSMQPTYLKPGALSKLSPEEATESMNKLGFLDIDPETGQSMVKDLEKMTNNDRYLFADWIQNLGDHGLHPQVFGSVDEMFAKGMEALKPIINPAMQEKLRAELGDEAANWLIRQSNEVADKISKRSVIEGNRPLKMGPAEAGEQSLLDHYSGVDRGKPWWMGPVMQAKLAPTVMTGMVGGIEFDREDGVEIPFLGGRKIGWNPYKALAWAAVPGLAGGKTGIFGPAIKRASKGVTEKLWSKVELKAPALYDFAASIHPTMRVPKDIYSALSDYLRIRPAIEQQFNQQVLKLKNNFTNDELSLLSDIIEKEGTQWIKAPQVLQDQAKEVQAWIKDIREGLIESGYPKEVLDKLGEAYLPRVYGPKVILKRPITTVESTYRGLYGDFLFQRGLPKTYNWKDPEIQDVISHIGAKGLKPKDKIYQFNLLGSDESPKLIHQSQHQLLAQMRRMPEYHQSHEWEIERWTPKRVITLRRDYNRLERDMMGEKRNAAFRLSKFVRDAAHDTALGHAYKRIAENTEHIVDLNAIKNSDDVINTQANLTASGWITVPDNVKLAGTQVEKYGSLAGKMISPDAWKIVKAMASTRYQSRTIKAAHSIVSKSTRAWKIGKTAFNPATHGYNWVANLHMCAIGGYDPVTTLTGGMKELTSKGDLYQRAVAAGMLDSNVLRGELDMGKFLEEINSIERGQVIDEGVGLLGAMAKAGKAQGRKAFYNALRTYEIGDEIFKLGIFRKEIAKGATDAEAIAKANEMFFDYRDIPPGIANIRDWGLMPFVSYTYKALPMVAKSVRDNPHRVMGILWFYSMLNEVSYSVDYGKDAAKQQAYERASQPEWQRDNTIFPGGPHGNVRMSKKLMNKIGMGANEGQATMLDVSHGVPLGDMFSDGGIFGSYPFAFHPAISLLGGLVTGKDPRFMKNIINEDPVTPQDNIDNAKARTQFIVRTLLPNLPFIPGQYSYEKIGNALTQKGVIPPETADALGWTGKDQFGGDVSLPKEVLGMFGLLKFREPYIAKENLMERRKKKASIFNAKRKLKYGIRDKRSSQAEIEGLRQNLYDTRDAQRGAIDQLNVLREEAPDEDLIRYPRRR